MCFSKPHLDLFGTKRTVEGLKADKADIFAEQNCRVFLNIIFIIFLHTVQEDSTEINSNNTTGK